MVIAEAELDVKNILDNPTAARLRDLAAAMSIARETEYNNLNVQTVAVARSSKSTCIVADDCGQHSTQCISRAEYERVTALQNEYITGRDMVVIDGYIGADPEFRTSARLLIEASNANVAAMQQLLYFDAGPHSGEPELSIIYTPNLAVDGYPDERLIVVDLDNYTTRIFNSDYFGESKKAGLRMWNKLVYDRGGLALHAGCKVIPVAGDGGEVRQCVGLIIGLSGTGKTTTTFTQQNNSLPVQDDFVAVMPDGRVYGTENGCFAKTYGLDVDNEPVIYRAVTQPESYLENVAQTPEGKVDFFDDGYTQNGRAVFPMSAVPSHPTTEVGRVDFILILNRNDNIIPAVCRLSGAQAAAYFMLGETKGTSAGGAAEAGKFLAHPWHEPVLPVVARAAGEPVRRASGRRRFRGLRDEHRPRWRWRRRRAFEQGQDPSLERRREGHRRGDGHVGARSRLRLRDCHFGARDWRRRRPPAAAAAVVRGAGPPGGVRTDRRAYSARPGGVPGVVARARPADHCCSRLAVAVGEG